VVIILYNIISIEDALYLNNCIFIDVRSPSEYDEATIPNSINIPLFSDEERHFIGKKYKENKLDAKKLGIKFASKKLENIYERIIELKNQYQNIVIFCWRGGMRSSSICNLLSGLNIKGIYQLKGGYKSYRKLVNNFIENEIDKFDFIVLHGLTGVGKTYILKELRKNKIPILDFEGMAKNAGSVFGGLLFDSNPPTQKNFEAAIFNELFYNKLDYVVVESESKRIGYVNIPNSIISKMETGIHILVNTNIHNRVNNLYNDYINSQETNSPDLDYSIIKSLQHLKKRLGNEEVESLILNIKNKNYYTVIENLINQYYDPLYKYSIRKIDNYDLIIDYNNINEAIDKIIDFVSSLKGRT